MKNVKDLDFRPQAPPGPLLQCSAKRSTTHIFRVASPKFLLQHDAVNLNHVWFFSGASRSHLATHFVRSHEILQEHKVSSGLWQSNPCREKWLCSNWSNKICRNSSTSNYHIQLIPITKQNMSFFILSQRTHLGHFAELKFFPKAWG